jgi:hypothetical protein
MRQSGGDIVPALLIKTISFTETKMPLPDPMIRKDKLAFLILSSYTRYTVYIHSQYIIYALSAKDEYLNYTLPMHYLFTTPNEGIATSPTSVLVNENNSGRRFAMTLSMVFPFSNEEIATSPTSVLVNENNSGRRFAMTFQGCFRSDF